MEWEEAIVEGKHSQPRSYTIRTERGTLRRNRKDLVKQPGGEETVVQEEECRSEVQESNIDTETRGVKQDEGRSEVHRGDDTETQGAESMPSRRSGRIIRPPDRYGEWDLNYCTFT